MFLSYYCNTVWVQNLVNQDKEQIIFLEIMSIKPSHSSNSSYLSSPDSESQTLRVMKPIISSTSTPSQNLLHPKENGRKIPSATSSKRSNDISEKSFLSVRKNVSLMKTNSNFADRLDSSG